jgi:hypothetical protein
MEEEWKLELQLQLKDAILSDKDESYSSPPCLTPTDNDSSHSYTEDDFLLLTPKVPKVLLHRKFANMHDDDKRHAVAVAVVKEEGTRQARLLQPQKQQQQALNNERELRETQEQLLKSQHRIAELEKRVGTMKQQSSSTSTSTWYSLDPANGNKLI